jgi:chitinase
VVLPFVTTALASRTPFRRSVESLRAEGVKILLGLGASSRTLPAPAAT